ncbi:D-tyrosyl-tRNA(Tyr) deacylase [Candidatus Woesebacteria bacterium RBG_16_34_12]|uniref:D-aminoacyl-tRNA deacylase n=1 Tax=Candidatus Woesebacteria bacterium RBG_16_34_12 TaxID=1802480 RepID=A0A1F7XA44_9BACT|nr:MAG: D-tyrosyl-tRNA(Tyr) deacylase [Candidatus Woesebacteria bacterium RBG_16_34_12]
MRLVVQRVSKASVCVSGKVIGKIEKGLLVLVGVAEGDSEKDSEQLAEKLSKLRIMADENDKMNLSISDIDGKILVISQFTLHADTSKGNRPSFIKAAEPNKAEKLYNHFLEKLKSLGIKIETGNFGAYMEINCELDGPVTIMVDSR